MPKPTQKVITANATGVFVAYQVGERVWVDSGDAVACLKPAETTDIASGGLGRFYPYQNDDPVLSHGEGGTWIENYALPDCKPMLKRGDRVAPGTRVGAVVSLFGYINLVEAHIEGIFLEYLLGDGADVIDREQPVDRIIPLKPA